jgi:hypothetical protein
MGKRLAATLVALAALLSVVSVSADDVALPVPLQMALLVKVAGYDRNMAARAGDKVRVVILVKAGSEESTRVAATAAKALADEDTIAGLPHEQTTLSFAGATSLVQVCRARRVAIVYLATGFTDEDISALASALDGVDVLTASAVASAVPKGIVLGFDLVSGKPKLLVHLGQARKQNVKLGAEVLKLVKVYE